MMRIEVEVGTGDLEPDIVIRSLKPDNIDMPEGVSLHINGIDGKAMIYIECGADRMLTCRSTVDEVLMLIDSIMKSLVIGKPDS